MSAIIASSSAAIEAWRACFIWQASALRIRVTCRRLAVKALISLMFAGGMRRPAAGFAAM